MLWSQAMWRVLFRAQEYKNSMVEKGEVSIVWMVWHQEKVSIVWMVWHQGKCRLQGFLGPGDWFIMTKLQLWTTESFYMYYMIKSIRVKFSSVFKGDFPHPFYFLVRKPGNLDWAGHRNVYRFKWLSSSRCQTNPKFHRDDSEEEPK